MDRKRYGLFTAVAMIVGICIGSGIFFKADDILSITGGSIFLGILLFILGAAAIIFGGLTIAQMAAMTDATGGIITYAEQFAGKGCAAAFGWFHTFVYYPTLIVVVSWIVGVYAGLTFGFELSFELQLLIGAGFTALCFIYNTAAPKFGGYVQNISTVIKLLPLVIIAVLGLYFAKPEPVISAETLKTVKTSGWLSGIGAVAFSYDGWIVSTSLAHEVRDSRRNLPIALVTAPLIILAAYILYFAGISSLIGPKKIIEEGNDHVYEAAGLLFGEIGAKLILVFVLISVIGTVNGLVMGYIRMPYSMAMRSGVFPLSAILSRVNKNEMPVNSAAFAFAITLIWYFIHYLTHSFMLLGSSDISEISISMNYIFYIILYYQVFQLYKKGKIKSRVKGILFPLLASAGSLMILCGGLMQPLFLIYAFISIVIFAVPLIYFGNKP